MKFSIFPKKKWNNKKFTTLNSHAQFGRCNFDEPTAIRSIPMLSYDLFSHINSAHTTNALAFFLFFLHRNFLEVGFHRGKHTLFKSIFHKIPATFWRFSSDHRLIWQLTWLIPLLSTQFRFSKNREIKVLFAEVEHVTHIFSVGKSKLN